MPGFNPVEEAITQLLNVIFIQLDLVIELLNEQLYLFVTQLLHAFSADVINSVINEIEMFLDVATVDQDISEDIVHQSYRLVFFK